MRNDTRLTIALAALCATALTVGVEMSAHAAESKAATTPVRLQGDELAKAVAGKVVYMKTDGVTVPIHYKADKTMTGKIQSVKAMLAISTPKSDSGKWWIDTDRLCQRWSRWLDGKTHCYKLERNGSNVLWERNDGRKGRARLGN